jgi:hypothetical protein
VYKPLHRAGNDPGRFRSRQTRLDDIPASAFRRIIRQNAKFPLSLKGLSDVDFA